MNRLYLACLAIAATNVLSAAKPTTRAEPVHVAPVVETPGRLAVTVLPFNDHFRGWPVHPVHQQHPIRGSFLDPRAPGRSREYHTGIDVGVRDDKPDPDAPRDRTHRVFAIESGVAIVPPSQATRRCVNRKVTIGHFDYWHVDTIGVTKAGERIRAGQHVGWTCKGMWHLHLSELRQISGTRTWVNPLRPGGKIRPYVDRLAPSVRAIRFFTPAFSGWAIDSDPLRSGTAGAAVAPDRLKGVVDARALIADPQSFQGRFATIRRLRADLHPYRVAVKLTHPDGRRALSREVFRADVYLMARAPQLGLPILFDFHFAPATEQALPAQQCVDRSTRTCSGRLWFRLFADSHGAFWDTTTIANGAYRLTVSADDVAGNTTERHVNVVIANPPRG